jgi:hypothetical protein
VGQSEQSNMSNFPSIVSSYALILKHLRRESIDGTVLDALQRMIGTFFKIFPNMVQKRKEKVYPAIIRLFTVMHSKGAVFKQFGDLLVWNGLTLTISELPMPTFDSSFSWQDKVCCVFVHTIEDARTRTHTTHPQGAQRLRPIL